MRRLKVKKLTKVFFLLGAENNWQYGYSHWLIHDASAKGIRHIDIK